MCFINKFVISIKSVCLSLEFVSCEQDKNQGGREPPGSGLPLALVFPGDGEEGDEDVGWWHPLPPVFGVRELLTQPALKS